MHCGHNARKYWEAFVEMLHNWQNFWQFKSSLSKFLTGIDESALPSWCHRSPPDMHVNFFVENEAVLFTSTDQFNTIEFLMAFVP